MNEILLSLQIFLNGQYTQCTLIYFQAETFVHQLLRHNVYTHVYDGRIKLDVENISFTDFHIPVSHKIDIYIYILDSSAFACLEHFT